MFKKNWLVLAFLLVLAILPVGAAAAESQIERTTVSGMTILLEQTPSEVVEIALLLKSGSGLDPAGRKGAAQIMNNLVMLRLNYGGSGKGLGDVAVETQPDYTLIRIRTTAAKAGDALNEIKALLSYPLYSYDVIADLKKLYAVDLKALPALTKSYYEFNREFYGADHAYNNELVPEALAKVSGTDVYQWYRRTYQPGNALLSISGGYDKSLAEVEKLFANLRTEPVDHRLFIDPVVIPKTRRLDRVDPNGRVTSVTIGFSGPRLQDPEFPAFRIIAYYLEEYQHYFQELRVKQALFYTSQVMYDYLEKPKAPAIVFVTMTDRESLPKVEAETLRIIRELATEGIPQAEIGKVVAAIRAEMEARRKDGKGLALRNLLSFYLESRLVYDDQLLPRLERVTTAEIQKAAAKYLQNYIRVAYIPEQPAENF
ncbi:M16 family metallopeptidase [Hydrogenispora ethanolica]|nr:insulinase family protein [Hydrogenispora ethanolica]